MKKININKKIYGIPLTAILAIALVSAVLTYYAVFSVTLNVNQPIGITYTGNLEQPINCDAGETCLGSAITISNDGNGDKNVFITDNSGDNIITSYVGKMQFAQKDLQTWVPLNDVREEIEYTITGDNLIINGIPDGYTLIYYPNTEGDDFATNVVNIQVLVEGSQDVGNLPIVLDVGDDYCNIGEPDFNPNALVCRGAKLWLIPGTESEARTKLGSWDASDFLFETDLITYTKSTTGEVLVPKDSTIIIYPEYIVNEYLPGGDYIVTITIA